MDSRGSEKAYRDEESGCGVFIEIIGWPIIKESANKAEKQEQKSNGRTGWRRLDRIQSSSLQTMQQWEKLKSYLERKYQHTKSTKSKVTHMTGVFGIRNFQWGGTEASRSNDLMNNKITWKREEQLNSLRKSQVNGNIHRKEEKLT